MKNTVLNNLKWLCENGYIDVKGWQEDVVALDCINSIEKSLKALRLIARMGLDVGWFQRMLKEGMTYKEYNFSNPTGKYHLTKEKFDLLKEVLEE